MDQISVIDTKMHGYPGITGTFLVSGEKTALIETGPKSSVDNVIAGLEAEGATPDWIIVTHIHLDHAGAAGTLAARFPDARIGVHEVGAPHLVDPAKLWSSASRIYGDDMDRLWGGIDPIPEDRIEVLRDGDAIDLGGRTLAVFDTPGHAYHHNAYLDDRTGTIFVGDALGVRLPDVGVVRPATPPPEFHLTKAIDSIRRIQKLEPQRVCLTHFGPADMAVDELCDEAVEVLERWAEVIRGARNTTKDLDEVTDVIRREIGVDLEKRLGAEAVTRMEQTTSYWMNTWGYMRYMDKNEGATASS
ncbi:MAG TPA: MBL fold metallo-hydrolase [Actinomycetota bacterium]|nr:MBL fold metallo-hydrolase [Actinomycetota bacterium]